MKEQFVSYEIAMKLKEKGFADECMACYQIALTSQKDEQDGHSGAHGWKKGEVMFDMLYFVNNGASDFSNKNWLCCGAPLWQQVTDWLREKHKLHLYIETTPSFDKTQGNKYKVSIKACFEPFKWTTGHYYLHDTYYGALQIAIEQALTLI